MTPSTADADLEVQNHSAELRSVDNQVTKNSVDNQEKKNSVDHQETKNVGKDFVKDLKKLTDEETSKKFRWKGMVKNLRDDDISLAFVAASVIAVFMDPFFFYIPLVDVKNKCIGTDKRLQIVALIWRTVADFLFVWHMIDEFREAIKKLREGGEIFPRAGQTTSNIKPPQEGDTTSTSDYEKLKASKKFRKKLRLCTIDFLAILPIPQLLVVAFFTREGRHFGFLSNIMGWNLLLLLQYGPRTYIIIRLLGKLKEYSPKWFISGVYIFTCIVTGHILGGFWYFNAIQRQLTCWHRASCSRLDGECRIMYCDGDRPVYSIGTQTMINGTCSLDGGAFNYGIFSDGLKSGYMERDVSGGKLTYFMWLGLKYLSTNGTDLQTSTNLWENCFAILVAIIGMVLFAYLIGHMQQFLQSMAEKEEVSDKVRKKKQEWKKRDHVVPKEVWKQIWPWMQHKLEKDDDTDMEFLDCLPEFVQNHLRKKMLKKVLGPERFTKMTLVEMAYKAGEDKAWLEDNIYPYLKPVMYKQKDFIFRVGEPLDSMLYIVVGTVIIYTTSSTPPIHKVVEDDCVYGDEKLMSWASTYKLANTNDSLTNLPISTENVRCHTKVEGFVLTAKDLKTVLDELEKYPKNE